MDVHGIGAHNVGVHDMGVCSMAVRSLGIYYMHGWTCLAWAYMNATFIQR